MQDDGNRERSTGSQRLDSQADTSSNRNQSGGNQKDTAVCPAVPRQQRAWKAISELIKEESAFDCKVNHQTK